MNFDKPKYRWLLLLFTIFASACSAGGDDLVLNLAAEFEKEVMKQERIASVEVREYEYAFGTFNEEDGGFLTEARTFDKNGDYLSLKTRDRLLPEYDLTISRKLEHVSDERIKLYLYDENNELESFTWITMEKGRDIEAITFKPDSVYESRWTYEYDANGNLTQQTLYGNDEQIETRFVYGYNDIGERVEVRRFARDGSIEFRAVGKPLSRLKREWVDIDENGKETVDFVYTYDELGRIKSKAFMGSASTETTEYEYEGESSLIVKKIEYENEEPYLMYKYSYTRW